MKNKFAAFAMLFMAVFTLASCLNDDTDYSSTLEALTVQDICNFMKEFNKAGNHITVTMLPEE